MYKAKDKESGEIVALKIVRLDEDDEVSFPLCLPDIGIPKSRPIALGHISD